MKNISVVLIGILLGMSVSRLALAENNSACFPYDFYFSKKAEEEQRQWITKRKPEHVYRHKVFFYDYERTIDGKVYFFMFPAKHKAKRDGFEDLELVATACDKKQKLRPLVQFTQMPKKEKSVSAKKLHKHK